MSGRRAAWLDQAAAEADQMPQLYSRTFIAG
jgi:hypothetical protein